MARFKTIPFPIVGGTHESRSRPVSVQNTTNMYLQVNEYSDKQTSLQSFPGQKLVSKVEGAERGVHVMDGEAYRVVGEYLYMVTSSGLHIQKGIVTGDDRTIMEDDGDNLVVVSDRVYVYTKSTGIFQENTNVNLVNVLSVTIINNQFIYTTEDLSFMAQPGLPFDISGLDAVGAESSPDKLVRDYAFNQTIYRFGTKTTEPWYNSGAGNPPIDRIDGQEFSVGCGAIHSLANTDKALYWLGDDRAVYRVSGSAYERVSDDALSNFIESIDDPSDAIGFAFTIQGQDFYVITFPSGGKTFLLNEKLGEQGWTNLASTNLNNIYSGTAQARVYGKNHIASSGKWLTLEYDEYTQDTDIILRERTTQSFQAEDFISGARSLVISKLILDVEQGVGLMQGQGEVPRLRVELSIDGGRSYPHVAWMELGRLGEYTLRTEVDILARGQSFLFKLSMSDPVPLTIKGGWLKVKEAKY